MAYEFVAGKVQNVDAYSWWLFAENDEMVAWAGERFSTLTKAKERAESFRTGAAVARFETYLDEGSKYRWRAYLSGDRVASSGESFDSRYNAQRAAENVRANAGTATGP